MSDSHVFDYVVVGGGAAGCVLAARLASESGCSVALLERGRTDSNRWIHIPATFFKALQSQDADAVVSQKDASLNDQTYAVPQGRVIGGGSSVNGMIYMRGQQQDYNDWADRHGCTGWSYADVLPVFKRQEKNKRLAGDFHGTSGKLIVDDPAAKHTVTGAIIQSAVSVGIGETTDFNGAKQEGTGWYQVNAHNGQRQSSAHCFLTPELHRENLTVMTGVSTHSVRIVDGKAVAVEAIGEDARLLVINARKEIILTAGSFHTPKILMHSGIGPKDQLQRFGIDVVHNSAEVGANYQDHVGTPVTRKLKGAKGLYKADKGLRAMKHGFDYFIRKKGLLTSNLLSAGACVDTAGIGRPDVQFNFAPFAPGAPGQAPLDFHAVQVHPMTMRPVSRGSLYLQSSSSADSLTFNANALDSEHDMDTLRRGVRLAHDIFEQSPLRELAGETVWPSRDVCLAKGSNSLDNAIRRQARTIFHPAGTCRMGSDNQSVVDTELRVRGVDNLRVADCSVMPAITSGNTNAPTMMIADRCAELLLAECT
ncbi:GMC family oxidoreductase N-terminal domain-containing protein [Granulosicoccus sp.]|nr:GMC family oxidoreductase N-terminal domain-containing protein [Granulosicoccus sp.]MDB4223271.1 GMC family oxidoreductase N-terminal domain-containing protein [Granulosicoccus sp.]